MGLNPSTSVFLQFSLLPEVEMGYLKKDPAGAFASWIKHQLMSNGKGQPDTWDKYIMKLPGSMCLNANGEGLVVDNTDVLH